jgi:nucleoside 2-deoxyribosyltransferase
MLQKQILDKVWSKKPINIKPKVYLAGPMEYVKDFGTNWRNDIAPILLKNGFDVFNPAEEVKLFEELKRIQKCENKKETLTFGISKIKTAFQEIQEGKGVDIQGLQIQFSKIIREDLKQVITSDVVLCHWMDGVFSAGTSGELTVAKLFNIPVYMVCNDITKLPKWILGCVTKQQKSFKNISKNIKSILKARITK